MNLERSQYTMLYAVEISCFSTYYLNISNYYKRKYTFLVPGTKRFKDFIIKNRSML